MTTPGWAAVWTLIAGVAAAAIGSASAVILNRRRDRLLAQLDFINSQLRYFYGPLLALTEASERAWNVFRKQHIQKDARHFWDPDHPPTREARAAWLDWVTNTLIPTNSRMVEIISERADLLIEPGMPQCLTNLCAYFFTVKAVLASWDVESGNIPKLLDYRGRDLLVYLEDSFSALKREQVRLLKAITASSAYPLTQNTRRVELISDRPKVPKEQTASLVQDENSVTSDAARPQAEVNEASSGTRKAQGAGELEAGPASSPGNGDGQARSGLA